jgi:hypothetical protein
MFSVRGKSMREVIAEARTKTAKIIKERKLRAAMETVFGCKTWSATPDSLVNNRPNFEYAVTLLSQYHMLMARSSDEDRNFTTKAKYVLEVDN